MRVLPRCLRGREMFGNGHDSYGFNPLAYAIALDETFFKDSPKERLPITGYAGCC